MAEKNPAGPRGGLKIFTHGKFYYKTETAKGAKDFVQLVRVASLEIFRETAQKYLGTEEDPATHLQVAKFRTNSFLNVRGQLKKRYLPILLARKFPEFARVRYVVIDEIVSESGQALDLPIHLRSKAQLAELVRQKKMPIDPAEYVEVDELRHDILTYLENAEAFLKLKPQQDRRRQEERQFLELNDIQDETLPPPQTEKPRTQKSKNAEALKELDV